MTDERIALRELLEKGSDATFLRHLDTSNYRPLLGPASRIAASGCDVPLLTRPGHRLWTAGAALRGSCGVMRTQLEC